jgi:hypothetical protein
MKTYIGIKTVQAEYEARDGVDGYKVVYRDGYTSWSPAQAFEEAYFDIPADRAEPIENILVAMLGGIDALIGYEPSIGDEPVQQPAEPAAA